MRKPQLFSVAAGVGIGLVGALLVSMFSQYTLVPIGSTELSEITFQRQVIRKNDAATNQKPPKIQVPAPIVVEEPKQEPPKSNQEPKQEPPPKPNQEQSQEPPKPNQVPNQAPPLPQQPAAEQTEPQKATDNQSPMQSCIEEVVWPTAPLKLMKLTPEEILQTKDLECIDIKPGVSTEDGGDLVYQLCLHDDDVDPAISKALREGKMFEKQNLIFVAKHLMENPGSGFIDIGTNMGLFTMMAAKLGHPVVAVEPRPENIHRIARGISDANYKDVIVYQNAVSDVRTTMHLMTRRRQQGHTWVVCRDQCVSDKRDMCTNSTVDTIYMDDLVPAVQALNFKKAIVKIDIEGHEPHAIAESAKLFDLLDVRMVIMEWIYRRAEFEGGDRTQDLIKSFESRNFRAYRPSGVPLTNDWKSWPTDVCWIKQD